MTNILDLIRSRTIFDVFFLSGQVLWQVMAEKSEEDSSKEPVAGLFSQLKGFNKSSLKKTGKRPTSSLRYSSQIHSKVSPGRLLG